MPDFRLAVRTRALRFAQAEQGSTSILLREAARTPSGAHSRLVLETVHQKAVAVALRECNAIKSQRFGHSELTPGCLLRSSFMVSRA
jgi:hypothetical protein